MFLVSLPLVEFLRGLLDKVGAAMSIGSSISAEVSNDHVLDRQQSVSTDQRKKVFREMMGLGASSTISRRLVSCYNYFRRALLALLSPGFDAAVVCSSILDRSSRPIHFCIVLCTFIN